MKYIIALLSVFILSACTTTKPAITDFKLNIELDKFQSNSLACKEKTLKISKAFAEPSLMSLKMNYVQDKNKVFSYSKSQWLLSPAKTISKEIYLSLRDSNLFKNVNIDISRSRSRYIMEIGIEDFMQYYSKDLKSSYANVVININIIDNKDSSIVSTQKFTSRVKVNTLDAEGGVKALNTALKDVIEQNLRWLDGICK